MRSKKLSAGMTAVLAMFAVTMLVTGTPVAAQVEKPLHNFNPNGKDGTVPMDSLIFDGAGNLYGTTYYGGTGTCSDSSPFGCGTVFELLPKAGGGYTEKILHNFDFNHRDGYYPQAGLVFDASGNLYGTTYLGGSHDYGMVFELIPQAGGGWKEKVLHNFNDNGTDGYYPRSSLIFDALGNLYGTTVNGGTSSTGTVFELSPSTGGPWTEHVLYSFNNIGGAASSGAVPYAGVIFDSAGNLYGTTQFGGVFSYGTAFELTPATGGGSWTETVLHSFGNGTDAEYPSCSLVFDAAGNLYGTASTIVFELSPQEGGSWSETVLHTFTGARDGSDPQANLIFDTAGNLYGTTKYGGPDDVGMVFKLTPEVGGTWTETVMHNFNNSTGGQYPVAGLIFDAAGNLYSTTSYGGSYEWGTVFEITP